MQGEQEREIETKTFIHSSAQQPQDFDSVLCPVLLLETAIARIDQNLPSWRSQAKGEITDHWTEPRGARALIGGVQAEWLGLQWWKHRKSDGA